MRVPGKPYKSVSPLVKAILAFAAGGDRYRLGHYGAITKVRVASLHEMWLAHAVLQHRNGATEGLARLRNVFASRVRTKLHAGPYHLPPLQTLSILANDLLFVPGSTFTLPDWRRKMALRKQRDWRELCAAVTTEVDSKKLDSLVQELIRALDEGEREWRQAICSPGTIAANREGPREVLYD